MKYHKSVLSKLIQGSPKTSKITPRALAGRSQDAPRTSKDAQGPPKRHPKNPKGPPRDPQGPPSIPKACPQHVSDLPNLSNAHQKHAQSTSLIPEISPKKPMCLKKIYRFITFLICVV